MAYCVNHPLVETGQACPDCGQAFCDSCLVEFLGQRYCGPCRDRRLAVMQAPTLTSGAPLAGTREVDLGGWLTAGWNLVQSDLVTFGVASLLMLLLSTVTCGVLYGPMQAGLTMMVYRKMTYGTVETGNVFDGFRRFLWAFLAMLLVMGGAQVVGFVLQVPQIVVSITMPDNMLANAAAMIFYYGTVFPFSIFISGATFFVLPHIAARNANPVEALGASWEVFRRNPLMFCLTGFVYQLIASLGIVACCVGVLVTWPLITAATAKAYADHFGIEGWDAI